MKNKAIVDSDLTVNDYMRGKQQLQVRSTLVQKMWRMFADVMTMRAEP